MQRQRGLMRIGFSSALVGSLFLGAATGLFFGSYCEVLRPLGEAFVGLLQMTVLPYVALSLVTNVGRMSLGHAGSAVRTVLVVLCITWAIGLVAVGMASLAFPSESSGSFFSTSLIEQPEQPNFIELFIPANPFHALAHGIVPAVVVFSIGLGATMIPLGNKAQLIAQLDLLVLALLRLNRFVVRLAPLGVYAIVTCAVGTMSLAEFGQLQTYLLVISFLIIVLTFGVLPMLVAALTPIRYVEAVAVMRDPLMTVFVLGNSFAVLPMIVDSVREMLGRHQITADSGSVPEALIPLAFALPDLGRIARLVFIPFAAWFYGQPLDPDQFTSFLTLGFVGCFSKLTVTIPWLLDIMHLPRDIFQLYLAVEIVTNRLADVLKTMHIASFALIVGCLLSGTKVFRLHHLVRPLLISLLLLPVPILGLRLAIDSLFDRQHEKIDLILGRTSLFPTVGSTIVSRASVEPIVRPGESRVERIQRQGVLRVGFQAGRLPFSYFNRDGQLVGFDVEMAHRLARDLDVRIEFVRFESKSLIDDLKRDRFDIAISEIEGSARRAASLHLPQSYLETRLALVTLDYRKREFTSTADIQNRRGVKIALFGRSSFEEWAHRVLPRAQLAVLGDVEEFFTASEGTYDALITSAESGAAWTLRQPGYTVIVPDGPAIKVPLYYLTPPDQAFVQFLNVWQELKRADSTIEQLYDYWILGRSPADESPRWSIVRDVLHWVD